MISGLELWSSMGTMVNGGEPRGMALCTRRIGWSIAMRWDWEMDVMTSHQTILRHSRWIDVIVQICTKTVKFKSPWISRRVFLGSHSFFHQSLNQYHLALIFVYSLWFTHSILILLSYHLRTNSHPIQPYHRHTTRFWCLKTAHHFIRIPSLLFVCTSVCCCHISSILKFLYNSISHAARAKICYDIIKPLTIEYILPSIGLSRCSISLSDLTAPITSLNGQLVTLPT